MSIRSMLALLVIVSLTGCGIGSVAPILADRDIGYDARLLGTWQSAEGKESVVITALPPKGYALVYTDEDGKVGRFDAQLGRVGSLQLLDVIPEAPTIDASDLYTGLLLPLHAPLVVEAIGSEVRFRMFDLDSVKSYLTRQPSLTPHQLRDDGVILTGSTTAVAAFLTTIARRRGALGDTVTWHRRAP